MVKHTKSLKSIKLTREGQLDEAEAFNFAADYQNSLNENEYKHELIFDITNPSVSSFENNNCLNNVFKLYKVIRTGRLISKGSDLLNFKAI